MNPMLKRTRKLFCLLAALSILSVTFIPAEAAPKTRKNSAGKQVIFTSDAVVREWNQIAFTTIPAQPPFPANRWMAMVQVAVFEAVNAVTGKYEPYLGTISAPPGASAEAAAVMAAHGVLAALFPAQSGALDLRRDASLALIPDGQAKTDGMASCRARQRDRGRANDAQRAPFQGDELQSYDGKRTPVVGGEALFLLAKLMPCVSRTRPISAQSAAGSRDRRVCQDLRLQLWRH